MIRRWMARLAFSMFIIGGVLAWQGYEVAQGKAGVAAPWAYVLYAGAACCIAMGFAGVRARHEMMRE